MTRPVPLDRLLSKKKPLTKTVAVVLDPDLAEEFEDARRLRDTARMRVDRSPKDTEAAFALIESDQKLDELRGRLEAEDAVMMFRFRGIGRVGYEQLVDRHPPSAEQRTKAKSQGYEALAWNPETFPQALVAACLIEPELSFEQVCELWDSADWNQAELQVLLNAAVEVNGTRRTVELGKG